MEISIELQKELIDALVAFSKEKPFWESPIAVGLLAASAVIVASLLERWQAFRLQERQSDIEKHLRVHELQIEALRALSVIEHSVTPNNEPVQGADSHEWLSPVVYDLNRVIGKLDVYLKSYAHVSPSIVIKHIRKATDIANEHKWGVMMSDENGYEPTSEEVQGVVDLIDELSSAMQKFKCSVGVTDETHNK